MPEQFRPTREAALAQLNNFSSNHLASYGGKTKADRGVKSSVSNLSCYLSHRLLTESEVIEKLSREHKASACEAFFDSLYQRAYWKAWLEGRPQVLQAWQRLLNQDSRNWPQKKEYLDAVEGSTGIDCFDHWVKELKETGFLHHEERRAFASIWCFTLRLPWSLGVSFFVQHLLDGDVASNLLNWRSVAGLQKTGRPFAVSSEAVVKLTEGRFKAEGLAKEPRALTGPPVPAYSAPVPFPGKTSAQLGENFAILLTPDDLSPEIGYLSSLRPKLVLILSTEEAELPFLYSDRVLDFKRGAMQDAKDRAAAHFGVQVETLALGEDAPQSLKMAMGELSSLVYYEPFLGPWKESTSRLSKKDVGVKFFPLRRTWDSLLQPTAAKSFLAFKKQAQTLQRKGANRSVRIEK